MASTQRSNVDLNCSDAFDLSEADKVGALRVTTTKLLNNDFDLARSEQQPVKPIVFIQNEGSTPYDLVGTTYATINLFSSRTIDLLRAYNITGWSTFPVKVFLRDGSTLSGYHGLAVLGRCGAIGDGLSDQITLPPPVPEGRESPGLRGLCFPPGSWDGSDIFTSEDRASVFVTERVMALLQGTGVTNILFQRLSDITRMGER